MGRSVAEEKKGALWVQNMPSVLAVLVQSGARVQQIRAGAGGYV